MEETNRDSGLMDVYERSLPQVYGYLLDRCGERAIAEDLTSETFLAALRAGQEPGSPAPAGQRGRVRCVPGGAYRLAIPWDAPHQTIYALTAREDTWRA